MVSSEDSMPESHYSGFTFKKGQISKNGIYLPVATDRARFI